MLTIAQVNKTINGDEEMNDFIYEYKTKNYFGVSCVTKYLEDVLKKYGRNVLLAFGGGSVKKNGVYEELVEILKKAEKSVRRERMEENFNVFDFMLTEEDMGKITSLDTNTSAFFDHRDPAAIERLTNLVRNV